VTALLPTISPESFNKYVGIPFAWNGYDQNGVSCWGLFVLVYKELYGVDLPKHYEYEQLVAQGKETDEKTWVSRSIWKPLRMGQETTGDALHMLGLHNGKLKPLHCGIVVKKGLVLHSQEGTGVIISKYLSDSRYKKKVIGAYRVRLD